MSTKTEGYLSFEFFKMRSYVVKGLCIVLLIWLLILALSSMLPTHHKTSRANKFIGSFIPNNGGGSANAETIDVLTRIDKALAEIQMLKRNNAEMKKIILAQKSGGEDLEKVNVLANNGLSDSIVNEPSDNYEKIRRYMELDLKELWYNIRSHSKGLSEQDFKQIQDIYRTLRANQIKLRHEDGYENYRIQKTKELSQIVQSRIHQLQNPPDCNTARKISCNLNKGCGFGCQVHHVGYCLIVAYATGRTLVLDSKGWRYNRQGWDKVFLPLSETCVTATGSTRGDWAVEKEDIQVIQLPIVDFLKPKPPYLPVAIPSELASEIEKVHGEPHIWWVGQFMSYILRLQPQNSAFIQEAKEKMGFQTPIVGIHVRRTDKIGTEASFHSLQEYMVHVDDYFSIREKVDGKALTRNVFVASDDPSVITEAIEKYPSPQWEIYGDRKVAQSASVSHRYAGLMGIIKDVFLLAECDFVVCTFSSQVCRLAYELMQARQADASNRFISLDDVYYYGGGVGFVQQAESPHQPRNPTELELSVGDKIGVAGNHWNGMSKGTNQRTRKVGLYPSYKARNAIPVVDFPETKWWLDNKRKR